MRPRVLLIALTDWFGPTRLPASLRAAGFDVGLLSDPESLIAQSSFIDYRFHLSPSHIRLGLVGPIFRSILDFAPRAVIPCDEEAATLLQNLALSWDDARGFGGQRKVMVPDVVRELLLRALGDARSYPLRRNRALARRTITGLGGVCPPSAPVPYLQVAEAFAAEHGFPVVLTREERIDGRGDLVCHSNAELRAAYSDFTNEMDSPASWRDRARWLGWTLLSGYHLAGDLSRPAFANGPLLNVEKQMPGQPATYSMVALEGRLLAGIAAVAEADFPPASGRASVVRLIDEPAMTDLGRKVMGRFGYTGFAGMDFTLDRNTSQLTFLKFNPRPTPLVHLGPLAGGDLCAAFYEGLTGGVLVPQKLTRETTVALFPQDWMRDPDAVDRAAEHLDIPTDDARLTAAIRARIVPKLAK